MKTCLDGVVKEGDKVHIDNKIYGDMHDKIGTVYQIMQNTAVINVRGISINVSYDHFRKV